MLRGDEVGGGEEKDGVVGEGVGGRLLMLGDAEKEGWSRPSKLVFRSRGMGGRGGEAPTRFDDDDATARVS